MAGMAWKTVFLSGLLLLGGLGGAAAQGKVPAPDQAQAAPPLSFNNFGHSDPAVPELAQYDFFRGKWRVDIQYLDEGGLWQAAQSPAYVTAFFHQDGRTLQTIFTTPGGFFSTDIRSFNIKTGKWQVMFLNAKRQRWHQFEASQVADMMVTIVPGGYGGDEAFDVKTEIGDISQDRFVNKVYQTDTAGSWRHVYIMTYERES